MSTDVAEPVDQAIEASYNAEPPPEPPKVNKVSPRVPKYIRFYRFVRTGFEKIASLGVWAAIRYGVSGVMCWAWDRVFDGVSFAKWRMSKDLLKTIDGRLKYEERQKICQLCPGMAVDEDGGNFCTPCRCPMWKWSELGVKNSRAGHNCPAGQHPGSFVTAVLRPPGGSKCGGGCGGKNGS